jgi:hypothetical protein
MAIKATELAMQKAYDGVVSPANNAKTILDELKVSIHLTYQSSPSGIWQE